ncbi:HAD family hydrolase [Bdellovibrio sp. HCB2-146]|uniref:HAD family hydrolase n=1 Tax=Bdellovibrio sp. HCB2-146 TaxID=3394362 RepID=UPI0039BD381F
MRKIEGLLIDVDGTFVDSNLAHAQSWHEALKEAGIETTYQEVRDNLGLGSDTLLSRIGKLQLKSKEAQRVRDIRREIFHQRYLKSIKPFPSAQQLLQELNREYKIFVVSSATEEDLEALLKQTGLLSYIEGYVSAKDTTDSNESPIEVAIRKIQLPASKLLMLGSSPYAVDAAEECGIKTIAFTCGGWRERDLQDAVAVYKDPDDLLHTMRKKNAHVLDIRGHRGLSENI